IVRRSLLAEHCIKFPVGLGEDIVFTFAVLPAAKAIKVEQFVCYAWRTGRPGQLTQRQGQDNMVWSDQWRTALDSCSLEPIEVRAVVFKRMIRHGWSVLSDPVRLRGRLRREFFRRFSALYCERR